MNRLSAILGMFLFISPIAAQQKVIRLYEGPGPGSENWKQTEKENNANSWNTRIVFNVVNPTLAVFPADPAKANGTAAIIAPGGAFHALSIDSEGIDVAKWLNAKGVTCFVLRYRLAECKTDDPTTELGGKFQSGTFESDVKAVVKLAMADGLAAVSHVRKNAKEYSINPERIGIIGFSAGGTVAASVAYNYKADSRPNWVAPIYLANDWVPKDAGVPSDAPPMFVAAASDDVLGLAPHSVEIYNAWLTAKKPVEMHMYAKGGHGFGMRKQNLPSDQWIDRLGEWLDSQGWFKK